MTAIKTPPPFATWLLQRLGPRYQSESLAGDLFEEYQQGRTQYWYWRQVIAAICVGLRGQSRVGAAAETATALHGSARRGSARPRSSLIKRLVSAFVVTALGAAALTWASGVSHAPHPVTSQSNSPLN